MTIVDMPEQSKQRKMKHLLLTTIAAVLMVVGEVQTDVLTLENEIQGSWAVSSGV